MKGYMRKYIRRFLKHSFVKKINISQVIIDLIVIKILWRTLNILENAESNHEKCIQMWLLC